MGLTLIHDGKTDIQIDRQITHGDYNMALFYLFRWVHKGIYEIEAKYLQCK